jgi:hypothetical protein
MSLIKSFKNHCSQEEFAANLEEFRKRYPSFYLLLKSINICYLDEKELLEKINKGLKTTCGSLYSSSEEDIKKHFIEHCDNRDFEESDLFYQLGIGRGETFDKLNTWLGKEIHNKVVFLETSLEALWVFLASEKAYEILIHPQVKIYYFKEFRPTSLSYKKIYEPGCGSKIFFHALLTYESSLKKFTIFFKEDLLSRSLHFTSIYKESVGFGRHYFNNFFSNLPYLQRSKNFSSFKKKFLGVPAIICGGGPSLEKESVLLKTLQDKALIFACGAGMGVLSAHGVKPHFLVAIDPNFDEVSRVEKNFSFETPLVYRSRINKEAMGYFHGPLLFNNYSSNYPTFELLEDYFDIPQEPCEEGHSSVTFAVAMALEMGCNPITFLGVDLSYSDEKKYSKGAMNLMRCDKENEREHRKDWEGLTKRKDIFGNQVTTMWKWITESFWLSALLRENPETTWINAAQSGIGFKCIANMSLKVIEKQFLSRSWDLEQRIFQETQVLPNIIESEEKLFDLYTLMKKEVIAAKEITQEIILNSDSIIKEKGAFSKYIGKKSELMDSFIFKYFVKDCWKVTERYHEHKRQALSLSSELKSMNKLGDELLSFIFLDEALERYELSIDKYLKNI